MGMRGSWFQLRSPDDPLRGTRDQSSCASAIRPGPLPAGRRIGVIRKRRWIASPCPKKRYLDAERSGWRGGDFAMDDRRTQFDRDGHRTLVVPEGVRRREQWSY